MMAKIQEKLTTQSPSDFFISFIDLIWAIPLITFFIVIYIIRAAAPVNKHGSTAPVS